MGGVVTAVFRELSEHELNRLSDDQVITYVMRARTIGELATARFAISVLVYGRKDFVIALVANKVPDPMVDDVVGEIILSAVKSAFDGTSVGEFVNWLKTIAHHRIVDFHREKKLETQPLPDPGDEETWGEEPYVDSLEASVEDWDIVLRLLDKLNPAHREVIELAMFGWAAKEIVERVDGMTVGNVDKVKQRFRDELREALGAAEDGKI